MIGATSRSPFIASGPTFSNNDFVFWIEVQLARCYFLFKKWLCGDCRGGFKVRRTPV